MTEAAHQIASNPLPPSHRRAGSAGVATGTEVAILGEEEHFLPAGETGEIVIRGESVMSGYEASPDANRGAFANGWFRTGDLGWLDSDGYLTITGRLKEIINRGGEKLSPREVEAQLCEHPAVRQAAAFAVPHPSLGQDVAAAVVLEAGASVAEQVGEVREPGGLADGKRPAVDDLRRGLADRLAGRLAATFVAPRGDTETFVARLFAEVLGVEQVGAADNFFALGGDSLRGGQLVARVRARRGVDLQLPTLFRKPTVAEFARAIDAAPDEQASAALAPPLVRRR